MSCSLRAKDALQIPLRRLDRKYLARDCTGRGFLTLNASTIRLLHTQFILRSPAVHTHSSHSQTEFQPLPSVDGDRRPSLLRQNGLLLNQKGELSGLGAVGQQTKDLQERVASIATISDQAPGRESTPRKAFRSTPGRLARRERRMPRRRFEGDRTRPEVKRSSSAKIAKEATDPKVRRAGAEASEKFERKGSLQKKPLAKFKIQRAAQSGAADPKVRRAGADASENPERRGSLQETPMTKFKEQEAAHSGAAERPKVKKPRWRNAAEGSPEKIISSARASKIPKEFSLKDEQPNHNMESWGIQKQALKEKFGEVGWMPRKRLSPDALDGIRTLHAQHPESYSTPVLAQHFKVSPEAIRRILKSKWSPNEAEEEKRKRRWEKRGENIWKEMSEQGFKPPKPWREKGIGRLSEHEGRGRRRSFAALESEIGTEGDQDVVTTRVKETRQTHKPLAQKIF